jgi:hypothetical protein
LVLFLDQCEMTHRPWMPYCTKHAKWGITKFSFVRYRGGAAGRAEGFAIRPRFGMLGVSGGARLNEWRGERG